MKSENATINECDLFSLESIGKFFEKEFMAKDLEDSLIFYRKGYEFLADENRSMRGEKVREDRLIMPDGALYQYKECVYKQKVALVKRNIFYFKRGIYLDEAVKDYGFFNNHMRLDNKKFQKICFEKIIGFEINKDSAWKDCIYHTFSEGIELFGLSLKAPKSFRNELENVLAQGMCELHNNNIEYGDPLPTNMRYNFDGKIILNPHSCIQFHNNILSPLKKNRDYGEPIERDLAVLLYTHDWIKSPESFVKKYLKHSINKLHFNDLLGRIHGRMAFLEDNMLGGISSNWQQRGKIGLSRYS